VVFDIERQSGEVTDARDRIVMRYDNDMLGTRIYSASMEAGERWMLNDVAGQPIYAWDSRNHQSDGLRFAATTDGNLSQRGAESGASDWTISFMAKASPMRK